MNARLILLCCFCGLLSGLVPRLAQAQQAPGISLFAQNFSHQNPAFVGLRGDSHVQLHYRNQWTNYQTSAGSAGSLGTQILSLSLAMPNLPIGLGLLILNDKVPSGVGFQQFNAQLAYHLAFGDRFLSFGLRGGMLSKRFDGRSFIVRDPNDPLAAELSGKEVQSMAPNVGLGVLFSTEDFYLGLQADYLNRSNFSFGSSSQEHRMEPMLHLNAAKDVYLTEDWMLQPFAQLRYYSQRLLPEAGARLVFKDLYWLGGSYRNQDAGIVMAGAQFMEQKLSLGYALDISTMNAVAKAPLSHEIFVRFQLPNFKTGTRRAVPVRTPRFKIL